MWLNVDYLWSSGNAHGSFTGAGGNIWGMLVGVSARLVA